jgi:hypothetical protein
MKAGVRKVKSLTSEFFDLVAEHIQKYDLPNKVEMIKEVRDLQKKFTASESRYMTSMAKLERPDYKTVTVADCKEVDEKFLKTISDLDACEILFYGFAWTNKVRMSVRFKPGFSFEAAKRKNLARPQPYYILYGIITGCSMRSFKSGSGKFCALEVIDENMHTNIHTAFHEHRIIPSILLEICLLL